MKTRTCAVCGADMRNQKAGQKNAGKVLCRRQGLGHGRAVSGDGGDRDELSRGGESQGIGYRVCAAGDDLAGEPVRDGVHASQQRKGGVGRWRCQ